MVTARTVVHWHGHGAIPASYLLAGAETTFAGERAIHWRLASVILLSRS
ncbi:hypothetical protein P5P93_24550 [Klebsiella pneumoniae]|nr:hypothetical protein P5P93_24550 [Klebsiella pneumoniae]